MLVARLRSLRGVQLPRLVPTEEYEDGIHVIADSASEEGEFVEVCEGGESEVPEAEPWEADASDENPEETPVRVRATHLHQQLAQVFDEPGYDEVIDLLEDDSSTEEECCDAVEGEELDLLTALEKLSAFKEWHFDTGVSPGPPVLRPGLQHSE